MADNEKRAPVSTLPSIPILTGICALAGAAMSGVLGGLITSVIWVVQTPEGARRAIEWGMLHGLLIGAAGIVTGALAGLSSAALAARLSTSGQAARVGAAIGAVVGACLGAGLWGEASGPPVAVASVLAHMAAGMVIAVAARSRVAGQAVQGA